MKSVLIAVVCCVVGGFATAWADESAPEAEPQVFTTRPDPNTELVPLPRGDDVFHFVIFGDRTGGPVEGIRVLEQAVADTNLLDPDLVLTVGDLINGYNARPEWLSQMKEYRGVMNQLNMSWFPVAGNHDVYWRGPNRPEGEHEADYEMHFGPLWYAFRHKNAGFIALFSDEGDPATGEKSFHGAKYQNVSDEQMAFIKEALARLKECDHVFLFLHHPRWLGGKNYGGSNWDVVHKLLAEAGNVSAVFGGHIHQMTYAGKKDGIEYFTLGAVGAHLQFDLPQAGFLHQFNVVTVREDEFHVAAIPVGTVIDPREFTLEKIGEIEGLVRNTITRKSEPIPLDLGAEMTRGTYSVAYENPTSHPLEVTLLVEELGPGWIVLPDHQHFRIEPGKTQVAAFRYRCQSGPIAGDFSAPRLSVQTEYIGDTGRVTLPKRKVSIDYELIDAPSADQAPKSDDINRAASLSGKGALRVESAAIELPDGPFTLEAWVNPRSIEGSQGLIAKTQSSEYSLFLNDGKPLVNVHLDGKYVNATAQKPLKAGEWAHIAGVFSGEELILYVNGEPVARTPASGQRTRNELPLFIGADTDGKGRYTRPFDGYIDDVRLTRGARYLDAFEPSRSLPVDETTVLAYDFDFAAGPFAIGISKARIPARKVGSARLVPVEMTLAP